MERRLSTRIKRAVVPPPRIDSRPKKKQRTTKTSNTSASVPSKGRKRSRIAGKGHSPEYFSELPAELLLEIFGFLTPVDVLHLYRASKYFHEFLGSSAADYLWQQAYTNMVKSPPIPVGVNFRHFTNYLYGRHCYSCASSNAPIVHDTSRTRFCSACSKKRLVPCYRSSSDSAVSNLCQSALTKNGRYSGGTILQVEYERISKAMADAKAAGDAALRAFNAKAMATKNDYQQFATKLSNWKVEQERIRAYEEEQIRQTRFNSAKSRLTAEGYDSLVWANQHLLQRHPSVCELRELSDEEWSHIRVDIINELQAHSDQQSESLKQTTFVNSVKALEDSIRQILSPVPDVLPATWLIAQKEPFRNKIKNSYSFYGPTSQDFQPHKKSLKDVIDTWRSDTDAYLLGLIPQTNRKVAKGNTALALATSFFSCYWCSEPVGYPRILVHYCEGRRKDDEKRKRDAWPKLEDFTCDDEGEESADEDTPRQPRQRALITKDTVWDKMPDLCRSGICAGDKNISFDEEATEVSRCIVRVAKKSPEEPTFEALNQKDIRIQCVRCSNKLKGKPLSRLVMTWTKAIMHHLQQHSGEEPSDNDWKLVNSKDDLAKAKEAEAKAKWQSLDEMCCNHCGVKQDASSFGNHLRQIHNIKVGEKKVLTHYREPFDISMKSPPHPVKI